MDAHRGGAPPAGQQVVHVRGDSKTELEALFSAVMNPGKAARQPQTLPMRMRKLPDSFFKPPDPRGHSRQASSDGGVCGSLVPTHARTISSPACLGNSLSAQADADVSATPIIPDDVPLPDGWEMAKTPTGQRYFINHLEKTTTWQDPRLSQLQSAAAQHPICAPVHTHSFSNPAPTTQPQNIKPETGPLPEGWEQAVTADGEVYYIDHINKNTTWVDPRLAQKMNPAILSLAMQQRQEKERLRCKQGLPPQITPQDTAGRTQMPGGMDHDRSAQMLVPSVDVRIRALNQEPTLNGAHSRNESTDSGLSVSSLPRTSDHMLSSVDHMDTGDSSEPPPVTMQESMPVLPINEGEELMPCIPDGLNSDLLMDMETVLSGPHMDRDSLLTWL